MTRDLVWIALLLASAAGSLLAVSRLGARFAWSPELRRKLLHFGSGALALTLPWVFDEFWPVATICGVALLGLVALRRARARRPSVGEVIHGVARRSWGDLAIPVAAATLFLLTDGEPLTYSIPLLVLTTADGLAALIALRYGLSPFATIDGRKTFEGTVVCFLVAFLATLVPLLLFSDLGRAEVLLVSGIVAVVAALIEATSWLGLDNLFIPLGTWFVLQRCMTRSADALGWDVGILAALAVLVFVAARRARLTVQARFAALVVCFLVWGVGGAAWVAPGVMVLVLHPQIVELPRDRVPAVDLRAVLSVATAAAVWLPLQQVWKEHADGCYYAYCVALAAHLAMTADVRAQTRSAERVRADGRASWALQSTAWVLLWYVVLASTITRGLLLAALALPLVLLSGEVLRKLPIERLTTRCWAAQALLAILASSAGFAIHALVGGSP